MIWTTTPWTIPGNRAISFSSRIGYGLYEVTQAADGNWAKVGETFVLADKLAAEVMKAAKVEAYERRGAVSGEELARIVCAHPLRALGYDFDVPLLDGDHVTDDTGTGFVHTAPGHGADDYIIWMETQKALRERGIDTIDSVHGRRRRGDDRSGAGLRGQARAEGERRQGRCQRRRDQGACRGRHDGGARAAETSVSALLALQEAGDLPQYAAVVHPHGWGFLAWAPGARLPSICARRRSAFGEPAAGREGQ